MAFDSREYEYADLNLMIGGVDFTKFRRIMMREEIEREAVYAKGREPHSIQSGNISYTGEITLLQSEYEALLEKGNGSLFGLAVDMQVDYGNPPDPIKTKRVFGARFNENEEAMDQGDQFMEITLPFVALKKRNQ